MNKRRGSIGKNTLLSQRRASLPPSTGREQASEKTPSTPGPSPRPTSDDLKEVFFDADEMPGSNKKKRQASGAAGGQEGKAQEKNQENMEIGDSVANPGVDPAMLALLMSIKKDINDTTTNAVGQVNDRIDKNARAIKKVGENTSDEIRKLSQHMEDSQSNFEEKITKQLEDWDRDMVRRIEALEHGKTTVQALPSGTTPRQQEA